MYRLVLALLAVLVLVVPSAQAQATKDHLDAMEKALRGEIRVVKDDVATLATKLTGADGKLDKLLEVQAEHGKDLAAIKTKQLEHDGEFALLKAGQMKIAIELRAGFDGLGKDLAEIKEIAKKGTVNVTNNNTVNAANPCPPTVVEKIVHIDRPVYVEKEKIVYVDREVYKDRVVVRREYIDRYLPIVVPTYTPVYHRQYYDCYGRFMGYGY